MENKRKKSVDWKTQLDTKFVLIITVSLLLFTLTFGILVSSTMYGELRGSFVSFQIWQRSFVAFLLIQLLANIVLLFNLLKFTQKITGAVPRIRAVVDKAMAGDYAARINLRKSDNPEMLALADKINELIDRLQKK